MTSSLMQVLTELTFATSVSVVVVALLRRLVRSVAGVEVAYWLWLLVPMSALAVSLPPLPFGIGGNALAGALAGALETGTYSAEVARATVDYSASGTTIWAAGCAFMLLLAARRQRAFLRSLGDATLAQGDVCSSAAVRGPLLVGIFRPRIVVPTDFESRYDPEERALILAHERAHLRRGDIVISAVATLWLCIFWFNPLVYWALARLRLDQELACDAAVLATSRIGRRRYASVLLRTHLQSEPPWRAPVVCAWNSSHPLKERVVMLSNPLPTLPRRLCGAALTAALILSGGCAVWSASSESERGMPSQLSEEEHVAIRADRIVQEDGDSLLSGNVVIMFVDASAGLMASAGAPIDEAPHAHAVVVMKNLRLVDDKFVIMAENARVERDGKKIVLTTDSARISPIAKAN